MQGNDLRNRAREAYNQSEEVHTAWHTLTRLMKEYLDVDIPKDHPVVGFLRVDDLEFTCLDADGFASDALHLYHPCRWCKVGVLQAVDDLSLLHWILEATRVECSVCDNGQAMAAHRLASALEGLQAGMGMGVLR